MAPFKLRLGLGLVCGILYALTNGALVGVITTVVDLVFQGTARFSMADKLAKVPVFLRPTAEKLVDWLPQLNSPSSKLGLVLVISTIPAVMFLRALFAYLNIYLTNWAAVRAVANLRTKLFGHLQDLPLAFFSQARTGELISRITSDTLMLHMIIGNSIATAVKDPLTILFLLGYLVMQQRTLTLISVVVLPVCLLPIIIYGRKVRKSARAAQTHAAELSTLMHESFTGNRIIKAYNLEDTVLGQFRETTQKYVSHVMRVLRANEIPSHLMEFLAGLAVALVFVYVKLFPAANEPVPTPGDFIGFIGGIFLLYQPIKNVTRLHNQVHQAMAASQRVFELLDTPSTVLDPPAPLPLKAQGADIRFENIEFTYGEKPVLRGVNLTVKAGQMVALVGASGSGKTTLANLLLRFYDPQGGTVRIGGTDIRQVALKDLRRHVALVAQETILFNDTVRRNISVGRPGATDNEIEVAAKHAYAHDFIMANPEGYAALIGEKGGRLSVGQRQRLTIARAILRDAPILVLDEATSALDAESERAVQVALEELMHGRTTICIAHRLSTIQNADLIVVLDQGRIVETGTHAQLLAAGGIYRKLYELSNRSEVS